MERAAPDDLYLLGLTSKSSSGQHTIVTPCRCRTSSNFSRFFQDTRAEVIELQLPLVLELELALAPAPELETAGVCDSCERSTTVRSFLDSVSDEPFQLCGNCETAMLDNWEAMSVEEQARELAWLEEQYPGTDFATTPGTTRLATR